MREAGAQVPIDQVQIDTIKRFIEVTEQNLARAREGYRLLGLGITNMEEFLAEDLEKLRIAEGGDAVAQRGSRNGQQL